MYASAELLNDKQFILQAVGENGKAFFASLKYLGSLSTDIDVINTAKGSILQKLKSLKSHERQPYLKKLRCYNCDCAKEMEIAYREGVFLKDIRESNGPPSTLVSFKFE